MYKPWQQAKMTKTLLHITFILIIFISACSGQTSEPTGTLRIKDFEFDGWFGYRKNVKTDHNYSLLGTGFSEHRELKILTLLYLLG